MSLIKHGLVCYSANNLWQIKGDRKPVIKASWMISLQHLEAVTLWKLQSLLSVFRA